MLVSVPVLGEARTCLAARYPVGLSERPNDREIWMLGRETEWPRPLGTWPRDRDLRRPNWDGRRPHGFGRCPTLTMRRWPMAEPHHN